MDRTTRAQIDSLLYELRSVRGKKQKWTIAQLSTRFRLDPLVVKRIAEAEGFELDEGDLATEQSDPNQDTQVMETDRVLGDKDPRNLLLVRES